MDENSSLTDFAGDDPPAEGTVPSGVADDGGGEVPGAGDEGPDGDADTTDEADDEAADASGVDDAVVPAVSTYRWSPEGQACADCGETVERRWLDGEAYVCGDCKEW